MARLGPGRAVSASCNRAVVDIVVVEEDEQRGNELEQEHISNLEPVLLPAVLLHDRLLCTVELVESVPAVEAVNSTDAIKR
jgi:hypothetical protein